MMKNTISIKRISRFCLFLALSIVLTACGTETAEKTTDSQATATADREVIHQVSLLQGLSFGDYNGSISVGHLKELGDIGIGTFNAVNGELILLDGVVYRAAYDGSIEEVPDDETVPFADSTFFDADESLELSSIDNISILKKELDKKVQELGNNRFYMVKIDGTFNKMKARSELPQTEPYKPLATVLETDQAFFDYNNMEGTVVGLYCPDYMGDINTVGWHFHFISGDRSAGGHVIDLSADVLNVSMDRTDSFSMVIPDNEMFNDFDFTIDQSDDIEKIETGRS